VLVGANGPGKTTLLDVRVLLGDLLRERTISAGFTEQREGRPPRATALRELIAAADSRHPGRGVPDGAAICRGDGAPLIALTLRYDRLDNFWFTLLHEFAHVSCHLSGDTSVILDDLDVKGSDKIEAEADEFARNAP